MYYLVILGVVLDGGEWGDLGVLELIGGSVHLRDDDVIVFREMFGQLFIDGFELLAVAAPVGKGTL